MKADAVDLTRSLVRARRVLSRGRAQRLPTALALLGALLAAMPSSAEAQEKLALCDVIPGHPPRYVPDEDRIPKPAVRQGEFRNRIALELGGGGWKTFQGDLHNHSRGHATDCSDTPWIPRPFVNAKAHAFGYDFFAITNHSTSWSDEDEAAPLTAAVGMDAAGDPEMLLIKGVEDYWAPDDKGHATSFHRLINANDESIGEFHDKIFTRYSSDPQNSTHIQINHPADFGLQAMQRWVLPSDSARRPAVRDAVELLEWRRDLSVMLEFLRRGFRVAPVGNSDMHSGFREFQEGGLEKNPDGSWKRRYLSEPGVPNEIIEPDKGHGRTGLVLPPDMTLSYASFLTALRNRWVFSTSRAGASGFFTVNGRTMGSEFARQSSERRLDFTVWGTTLNGVGDGQNDWRRIEVWSPAQTGDPVYAKDFTDTKQVNLKHLFSLTPYESVYFIRMFQANGTEVALAPVWISNPLAKPTLQLDRPEVTRSSAYPAIVINGGAMNFLIQRLVDANWQTVAAYEGGSGYYPLDNRILPRHSQWRVVDALMPSVASNPVTLTITDAPSEVLFDIRGDILTRYGAQGFESGWLGLPIAAEALTPEGLRYQRFQYGVIIAVGSGRAYALRQAAWDAYFPQRADLGAPTGDTVAYADGGWRQPCTNGHLVSHPTRSGGAVRVVRGSMLLKYAALGHESGWLGYPVSAPVDYDGLRFQRFEGGVTVSFAGLLVSHLTAYALRHPVWERYFAMRAVFGKPIDDTLPTGDGVGFYSWFEHVVVHWSPSTGAFETHGSIRATWEGLGWQAGVLGYPITDETGTPDGVGRYNHFQRGSIYFHPDTGAHPVLANVRHRWAQLGWELGSLRYPTKGGVASGGGEYAHFQRGAIYWRADLGARVLSAAVRTKYAALGAEAGALGYPTTDTVGQGTFASSTSFQGGGIWVNPTSGLAHVVFNGPVLNHWVGLGGLSSRLGYPSSDETRTTDAAGVLTRRVTFTGGSITARGSVVSVTYSDPPEPEEPDDHCFGFAGLDNCLR